MSSLKTRLARLEQTTLPEDGGTVVVVTDPTGVAVKMTHNGLPYTGPLAGMRRIVVPAKIPAAVETRPISAQDRDEETAD